MTLCSEHPKYGHPSAIFRHKPSLYSSRPVHCRLQLLSMLNLEGVKRLSKLPLILARVSWSEFGAGTLMAQLGYFQGESGGLKLAETRVRSVLGEGLEPSRGKPSQDFKSCASCFLLR